MPSARGYEVPLGHDIDNRLARGALFDHEFRASSWKIIKSRDTNSISRRMYAVTVVGFALWLAY